MFALRFPLWFKRWKGLSGDTEVFPRLGNKTLSGKQQS
jgi:hypothetical protein